ncbi:MAG: hypothetical protein WDW38_007334 [Sanguina aurantia]
MSSTTAETDQAAGAPSADAADLNAGLIDLAQLVTQLISDKATQASAVGLMLHFPDVAVRVDVKAAISALLAEGQEALAESVARLVMKQLWGPAAVYVGTDARLQLILLKEMVLAGEGGLALEYCRDFGLPNAVLQLDPRMLAEEAAVRAATYLALAVPLERLLFVNDRWGDGARVVHSQQSQGGVVCLEGEEWATLRTASTWLSSATVIGLDVEWKPTGRSESNSSSSSSRRSPTRRRDAGLRDAPATPAEDVLGAALAVDETGQGSKAGATDAGISVLAVVVPEAAAQQPPVPASRASILQVATFQHVMVFDLITLCEEPLLDKVLASVLGTPSVLKLGFELLGDVRKLSSSYPSLGCFQNVSGMLDLKDLWVEYSKRTGRPTKQGIGLSMLSTNLLGKPLDKSMQVSNWEARPLSQRQLVYASQDAHVLLLMLGQLRELLPDADALIAAKVYSVPALSSSLGRKKAGNGAVSPSGEARPSSRSSSGTAAAAAAAAAAGPVSASRPLDATAPITNTTPCLGPQGSRAVFVPNISLSSTSTNLRSDSNSILRQADATLGSAVVVKRCESKQVSIGGGCGSSTDQTLGNSSGLSGIPVYLRSCLQAAAPGVRLRWLTDSSHGLGGVDSLSMASAADAAAVLGVPVGQVAKSLALYAGSCPTLIVTAGDARLDWRKVAACLGLARKQLRLATPQECQEVFGYVPGTLPPFGHATTIPVIVDIRLALGMPRSITSSQAQDQPSVVKPHTGTASDHADPSSSAADLIHTSIDDARAPSLATGDCSSHGDATGVPDSSSALSAHHAVSATERLPLLQPSGAEGTSGGGGGGSCAGSGQQSGQSLPASAQPLLLYCGSGAPNAVIECTAQQLLSMSRGSLADIVVDCPPPAHFTPTATAVPFPDSNTSCTSATATSITATFTATVTSHERSHASVTAAWTRGTGGVMGGGGMAAEGLSTTVVTKRQAGGAPVMKFLLDAMCGRMCRWLRCLGVDAEFIAQPPGKQVLAQASRCCACQATLAHSVTTMIRAAALDGRIFVTRDSNLAARRDVGATFLLRSDTPAEQMNELAGHFGIKFETNRAMTRCSCCNAADFRLLTSQEAKEQVPKHVFEVVDTFYACGGCLKVFWMGPKSYSALRQVEGLLAKGQAEQQRHVPATFGDRRFVGKAD